MKRIIITERQYKRLVNLPLNEQNVGGGEIKFSEGYSENDIKGNRVWKFLNVLREKLTDSEFENDQTDDNDQTGNNEVTDGSEESKYSIDFGDLEQGDIDLEDEPYEVIDVSEDTSFVLPIPNDNIKVVGRNEFLKSPANEKVDVEYVFDFFKGKGLKDYQSCLFL